MSRRQHVEPTVERLTPRAGDALTRPLELVLVALLLFAFTLFLQYLAGAYAAELRDDDTSHYISGALVHDYLLHSGHGSPIAYLKDFHAHYPLVGIGHWPPLYYLVEAAWMMVFGPGRAAMLLLSATVTAATAITIYLVAARYTHRLVALTVAAAFIAARNVQIGSSELMLDVPVALGCLLAALVYIRYLDAPRVSYAIVFALLAVATMMIKGTGVCLGLLPAFAVLIGRRWDLLRRFSFWLPAPLALIVVGPWYVFTYQLAAAGFRYTWGLDYLRVAISANAEILLIAMGPVLLALGLIGFLWTCVTPRGPQPGSARIGYAALFAAVITFQSIVPAAIQDRYLAPALPPLLLLAAVAVDGLARWVAARWARGGASATMATRISLVAVGVVALLPYSMAIAQKPQLGFVAAAAQVWHERIAENPAILVVTGAADEGAVITELAIADPHRPSLFVVRGSRLLGGGGYNTQEYLPKFQTPAEVMAEIDRYAIPFVLYAAKGDKGEWEHLQQVAAARQMYPDRWEEIYRDTTHTPEVVLFRVRGNDQKKADVAQLIALSAPRSLGE